MKSVALCEELELLDSAGSCGRGNVERLRHCEIHGVVFDLFVKSVVGQSNSDGS